MRLPSALYYATSANPLANALLTVSLGWQSVRLGNLLVGLKGVIAHLSEPIQEIFLALGADGQIAGIQ